MQSVRSSGTLLGMTADDFFPGAPTIFSPSPIHLLVRLLALMLKKDALMLLAMALPIKVLPVPGGPNSSMPFGGARGPCGRRVEEITNDDMLAGKVP